MSKRDPLNLRSLPDIPAPEELWKNIDQQLHPGRRRPRFWMAAAALAAGIGLVLLLNLNLNDSSVAEPVIGIEQYWAASALLEARIEKLQQGPVHFTALIDIGRMEDELLAIDQHLLTNPHDVALWEQRLAVLANLAGVYADRFDETRMELDI